MSGTDIGPGGWQFYQDGRWWNGDDRIKDHRKNTEEAGFPVRDLYTAPQSAQQGSVPEIIKAIADKLEKVEGESADGGYMWGARECAEFIREEADKLATTPQQRGVPEGWKRVR